MARRARLQHASGGVNTVAIIQARMTSSRLPGKSMIDIAGKPTLQHVIERVKRMKMIDGIVCALPDGEISKTMMELANSMGVGIVLGSEHNVLERYYFAARRVDASFIVRITADCPLLDPAVADRVVQLRKFKSAEYASNVWPRSFPKGLDVECFTYSTLKRAHQMAETAEEREHVTLWMTKNAARTNLASGRWDLADRRWTLDTPEDLEFIRSVFKHGDPMSMEATLKIVEQHGLDDMEGEDD